MGVESSVNGKSELLTTLQAPVSDYKFSFLVSTHFLQRYWGECFEISSQFNLSDHVLNSHDLSNLMFKPLIELLQ